MALVLTRKTGETVIINGKIRVKILGLHGNQVRLAIDAPKDVIVDREEIAVRRAAGLSPPEKGGRVTPWYNAEKDALQMRTKLAVEQSVTEALVEVLRCIRELTVPCTCVPCKRIRGEIDRGLVLVDDYFKETRSG